MIKNDGFMRELLECKGFKMVIDGELVEKWERVNEDGSLEVCERFNRNSEKRCSYGWYKRNRVYGDVMEDKWFMERGGFVEYMRSK